jgi:hypothetical protein
MTAKSEKKKRGDTILSRLPSDQQQEIARWYDEDQTLDEMVGRLWERFGVRVSSTTLSKYFSNLHLAKFRAEKLKLALEADTLAAVVVEIGPESRVTVRVVKGAGAK